MLPLLALLYHSSLFCYNEVATCYARENAPSERKRKGAALKYVAEIQFRLKIARFLVLRNPPIVRVDYSKITTSHLRSYHDTRHPREERQ